MDPERVPPLPQFETSPVHSLDKDTSGIIQRESFNPSQSNVPRPTARIITSNLSANADNAEPQSPEKLEVSEISFFNTLMIILRSLLVYNHHYLFEFPNQEEKLE